MHDAAGGLTRHERKAVVARVHAEEPQPGRCTVGRPTDQLRWQAHRVAQEEAEHIPIEVQRIRVVFGGQHDVAEALLLGDELVAVRAHHTPVLESDAVEYLQRVA